MLKKLVAVASVTALLAATTPIAAEAHEFHHGGFRAGPAIAFGALAGLAIGAAIVGSTYAPPPAVVYAPAPAYYPPPPVYYAPPPVAYAPYGYPSQ